MANSDLLSGAYRALLQDLKHRIQSAQLRASVSVNRELVLLYWSIGREILLRQAQENWGTKVIDRLADDLKRAFPSMKGFSPRNLKYMRALAEAWPDEQFVQQAVAQIPWGHNVRILDYVKDPAQRECYVRATIEHGWSRNVLIHQIESGFHRRSGAAVTNFGRTLPPPQSDLAQQVTKDPYTFDFLMLGDDAHERQLERGLLEHLRNFLLELGVGFAFVASQYRMDVGGSDFFIDLLFYHLKLRCFVVVDLKATAFQPEFAGKMNFYLAAVDDLLKHKDDQPSIGLIICKTKDRVIAEYALRNTNAPIGISEYRLAEALPASLEGILPTVEELEAELAKDDPSD
jgi:predicted nuclease of restriction endonuclease-like (RecB) superfamily